MDKITLKKRQRKNGTVWEYRIETPKINGKRNWITKSGFKKKSDAKNAAQQKILEINKYGKPLPSIQISYADVLEQWLNNSVAKTLKPNTLDSYRKKIKNHIIPYLGRYEVNKITKQHIKDFILTKYNEGYSINTLICLLSIISSSMNYAIDCEYIKESPSANLKNIINRRRAPENETRHSPRVYISKEKIEQILLQFPEGNSNYLPLILGYHCGLRIAETYALAWEDVDFENKKLKICRQVQWYQDKTKSTSSKKMQNGKKEQGNGYWYFTEPKYNSKRSIDIDDELIEALMKAKKKQEENIKKYNEYYCRYYSDIPVDYSADKENSVRKVCKISTVPSENEIHFIMTRDNGTYISSRTMLYASSIIHHKMNFKEFNYHSLRHTHATMLREAGAPDIYIQKRLGHTKLDVTLNVYSDHLTPKINKKGVESIKQLFKKKNNTKK